MTPDSAIVIAGEATCMHNPGAEYVRYLPERGTIEIDLGPRSNGFVAEWFSPRNGSTQAGGSLAGGGTRPSTTTGQRYWVLPSIEAGSLQELTGSPNPRCARLCPSPTRRPGAGAWLRECCTGATVDRQSAPRGPRIPQTWPSPLSLGRVYSSQPACHPETPPYQR